MSNSHSFREPRVLHEPKRRLASSERRITVVTAAQDLALEGGLDAVRLDAIAKRIGVSRPVVYDHFATRDALLQALFLEHITTLGKEVDTAIQKATDLESLLRLATHAHIRVSQDNGGLIRMLLSEAGSTAELDQLRGRSRRNAARRWGAHFARFREIPIAEATDLAGYFIGGLVELLYQRRSAKRSIDDVVDIHVAIMLNTLDTYPHESPLRA